MPSSQSWPAAVIDLATLAALVAIAFAHVSEPAAWTLLGAIVSGRFGVSLGKTIERVSATANSNRPPPDGGSGTSGPRYQAVMPPVSDRSADTMPSPPPPRVPRPDPRRERRALPMILAVARHYIHRPTAILVVVAVFAVAIIHGCTYRPPPAAMVSR